MFVIISVLIIRSLGKKPVRGGRPPRERRSMEMGEEAMYSVCRLLEV